MGQFKASSASRLAQSAYHSPYSRSGAPTPHPNTDPYAPLRARALATLEAMGFDPETMVEHGVLFSDDQDPWGHVTQAKYAEILDPCFHRVLEGYDEYLSEEEYNEIVQAKKVIPVLSGMELKIRRQTTYPDALIVAYRLEYITPTSTGGTACAFSLRQQTIVAEGKGSNTYMDVKTSRAADIRTLGGGWPRLYEAYTKKVERSKALREKWQKEHPKGKAKI